MGIIIIPFLFGALLLSLLAMIQTIRLIIKRQINFKEIILGLTISLSIFGLICLSYLIEGSAWGLSPAFRIPIFMVFIPSIFYFISMAINHKIIKYLANLILISIGLSGILGIIFNDYIFGIIDLLGIEKYY
jgi:hypothetical protein